MHGIHARRITQVVPSAVTDSRRTARRWEILAGEGVAVKIRPPATEHNG
jgi:hypothetical protein